MITITKDHLEFTALRIAAQISTMVPKYDTQSYVRVLYVDNNQDAYCTDRKAIITWETELEPGTYLFFKNTAALIILSPADPLDAYPDAAQVLNTDEAYPMRLTEECTEARIVDIYDAYGALLAHKYLDLFKDATGITAHGTGERNAVILECPGFTAAIMPLLIS